VNVEMQRSKRARPFCTHIDKIKPFEVEEMPMSWLQDAVGDTSKIGTDVDASLECTPDEDLQLWGHGSHPSAGVTWFSQLVELR